jgi:hypothetical protein
MRTGNENTVWFQPVVGTITAPSTSRIPSIGSNLHLGFELKADLIQKMVRKTHSLGSISKSHLDTFKWLFYLTGRVHYSIYILETRLHSMRHPASIV